MKKPRLVEQVALHVAPRLEQLTVRGKPRDRSLKDAVKSIKGYWFTNDCDTINFSASRWRHVQSMEIGCETPELAKHLVNALIHQTPTSLKYLVLRFDFSKPEPTSRPIWPPLAHPILEKRLRTLVETNRQLQSLVVYVTVNSGMLNTRRCASAIIPSTPGTSQLKLAFLSCVHHVETLVRGSEMSQFGVDVVGHVFEYVGHTPDFCLIHDTSERTLYFGGQEFHTQLQLVMPEAFDVDDDFPIHFD